MRFKMKMGVSSSLWMVSIFSVNKEYSHLLTKPEVGQGTEGEIGNPNYEEYTREWGFPVDSVIKNLPANARDAGLICGLGRSPGKGNGNPLQYSCLGNPMDRGAWWATYSPWGCGVGHDLVTKQQQP